MSPLTFNQIDTLVAEKIFGFKVIGETHCTNYDGCPSVNPDWEDAPILPVIVSPHQKDDYYKEENYLKHTEKYAKDLMTENPDTFGQDFFEWHMEDARENMVNGWHAFGLEPVVGYSSNIGAAFSVLEKMRELGYPINSMTWIEPEQRWFCVVENLGSKHGFALHKYPALAICVAALNAIGEKIELKDYLELSFEWDRSGNSLPVPSKGTNPAGETGETKATG